MLSDMRNNSQSFIIYFFFAVIIFVFVFFFGPQSQGCEPGRVSTVATVNGVDISSTQLEQLFGRVWQQENRGANTELHPQDRRYMLVEDIILVHLLANEAREAGLDVSDQQLADYVTSTRNFDRGYYYDARNDRFDTERYELGVASSFGMPLEEYEAWKASELLARDYVAMLQDAIVVSPVEVRSVFDLRNTRYSLEYLELDPSDFEDFFTVPDSAVAAALDADRAAVEAYFQANVDTFSTERQLRFSRILIRKGSTDDDHAEAESRYEEALAAVTENPDGFGDIAREYSVASDAVRGGDMGLKSPDDYESFPFIRGQIDTLELGSVETYESSTSYIIFTMTEDNPAVVPAFDDVAEQAARAMLEETDTQFAELAESLLGEARDGASLADAIAAWDERNAPPAPAEPAEPEGEDPDDDGDDGDDGDESDADDDADDDADEGNRLAGVLSVQETEPFAFDRPAFDFGSDPQFANLRSPPAEPEEIPGMGSLPSLARALPGLEVGAAAPELYESDDTLYIARLASREQAPDEIDEADYEAISAEIREAKANYLFGGFEFRVVYHSASTDLSPFLRQLFNTALQEGVVRINTSYFEYDPELVEESQTAGL